MSLSGGMMVLRAMVLGWMVGCFTSIHERVLYPSHRPGGEGNDHPRARNPPPPLQAQAYFSAGVLYTPALFWPYSHLVSENNSYRQLRPSRGYKLFAQFLGNYFA